jgi:outer membrane protein assembly factor BamB
VVLVVGRRTSSDPNLASASRPYLTPVPREQRGSLTTGVRWTIRPRLDSDGRYGRIQAIDLATRETLWTERQRAPQTTGVLATAGGLVFAGALDRVLTAYDDATGEALWQAKLNDVPSSSPITYAVDGKQYVAMTVGHGSAHALTFPMLTPEIDLPYARVARLLHRSGVLRLERPLAVAVSVTFGVNAGHRCLTGYSGPRWPRRSSPPGSSRR